jgi:hypothetical protein
LRLHTNGVGDADALTLIRECCRANIAVEKALGEAISSARAAGHGWRDIGEALGATDDATDRAAVIRARLGQQRYVWQRFWPDGGK